MVFEDDDKGGERRPRPQDESEGDTARSTHPKKKRQPASEVGQALRSAYQRTLGEDIPPEMLDLLGKLG